MALRGHHFAERCSECDAEADGHCPRCGEIFCAEHRPAAGDVRCDRCEGEYRERLAALEPVRGSYLSPLLIASTLLGCVAALAVGLPQIAAVVLAIGGFGSVAGAFGESLDRRNAMLRSSREDVRDLRAAFLAERTRLLGPAE